MLKNCEQSLLELPNILAPINLDISKLSDLEKQILVERHLISRELSESQEGAGVIISEDQTCSVMINEEDHYAFNF